MATAVLDADARARLADLADVLIPAGINLPSASEADVHHEWIDRVLTVRPDLIELLRTRSVRQASRSTCSTVGKETLQMCSAS